MATYLTQAGIDKLQEELKRLRKQKRELSEEVKLAREHGDLRENAEYQAGKERLAQVMEKINTIQMKLSNVEVVDPTQQKSDAAVLGTRVTVKDLSTGSQEVYTLVSPDESDPAQGHISVQSPLGRAFLGHKAKEKVSAALPAGARPYQILTIEPGA